MLKMHSVYLPGSPATANFLTAEQKELALFRIQTDSSAIVDEKTSVRVALEVFRMPQAWAWVLIEMVRISHCFEVIPQVGVFPNMCLTF